MSGPIEDKLISSYVKTIGDSLVGDDPAREIDVARVPARLRFVIKAAADGAPRISGAQLQSALAEAEDVIIKEDKTLGIHTRPDSFWRRLGIGGDNLIQEDERNRASQRNPVAARIFQLIDVDQNQSRWERAVITATDLIQTGQAKYHMMDGWSVRDHRGQDWEPPNDDLRHALDEAARRARSAGQ